MRITAAVIAGMFAVIPLAHADCSTSSGATRAHLIELYTSEGCSSCPPADHWLNALSPDATRVPLAFHVDYWDSPGWTDRFANPRFTQRQKALAEQSGNTIVYTPEVAFDGREWQSWSAGVPPVRTVINTPALELHVDAGSPLHVTLGVHLAATDAAATYVAYFAISEDKLSSAVRGGENSGVQLRHEHVVRVLAGPLELAQADATIVLPGDLRRENAGVVAFVQRVDDGEIANALQLPLRRCLHEPAQNSGG